MKNIYLILSLIIIVLTSFNIDTNILNKIRDKQITNNDTLTYKIKNYEALLSKHGFSEWVELKKDSINYYYGVIIYTNNDYKYNEISIAFKYNKLTEINTVVMIVIDDSLYDIKTFSYSKLIRDVELNKCK